MPHLWTGGTEAYKTALRQEYESARQRLQSRLDETDEPSEREILVKELEELKKDFQRRLKGIEDCSF